MTEEMNRARFTPGPWEARCRTGVDYVISSRDGCVVATTYWRENKEERYNAALIAAAPEMYEMLAEILTSEKAQGTPFMAYYERAITNLLAKARGEDAE